jgi:nucleoid DNA-binding protein
MANSTDRVALYKYINRKIKRKINHHHVFSVLSILFDELINDLAQDKKIKVTNFGIIGIRRSKPIRYRIKFRNKEIITRSKRKVYFKVAKNFKKKMIKFLDLDKMFKENTHHFHVL